MNTDRIPGSSVATSSSASAARPRARTVPQSSRTWPVFLATDLVLVVVFAIIGRVSHGESASGMLLTAWPFLIGAAVGWVACRGSRHPAAVIPTGLSVWLCAEVGGMVLRSLTGQGTALPFVVVSVVVLALLLLGYRAIVLVLLGALRTRRAFRTSGEPRTV